MQGHLGVGADAQALLRALGGGAAHGALDAADDGLGGEDAAGTAAVGAGLGERGEQGGTHALARHLNEAELGNLEGAGTGAVAGQVAAQLLEHPVLVGLGLHE